MIKLNASVSKKVPLPDVEYSSRSCSAGAEVSSEATRHALNRASRINVASTSSTQQTTFALWSVPSFAFLTWPSSTHSVSCPLSTLNARLISAIGAQRASLFRASARSCFHRSYMDGIIALQRYSVRGPWQ